MRRIRCLACFNPLHCGAVVASGIGPLWSLRYFVVSIPFIAGQWSLQEVRDYARNYTRSFQSPSLRGSGRFSSAGLGPTQNNLFQSPSLRGSGRFKTGHVVDRQAAGFNPLHCGAVVASAARGRSKAGSRGVSIPFIAGQWALRARRMAGVA